MYCIFSEAYSPRKPVLFTCTTFFDYRDRWDCFRRAARSLLETAKIEDYCEELVVINEYSASPRKDWAALMKKEYPGFRFIQKTEKDSGQARSLNMIMAMLEKSDAEYWLHWEETWVVHRPFMEECLAYIGSSDTTQIQLTPDWMDVDGKRILRDGRFCRITAHDRSKDVCSENRGVFKRDWKETWPLFSLRPSLNRLRWYRGSRFEEARALFPVAFEYLYACEWLEKGGKKAVYCADAPAVRVANHRSTYA